MTEKDPPEASVDVESICTPSIRLNENSRQALVTRSADTSREQDVWRRLQEAERNSSVGENPFAFSPAVLDKLFNPKSLDVFFALGGLGGLEIGLRTNRRSGLNSDEDLLPDGVSFDDVKAKLAGNTTSSAAPQHLRKTFLSSSKRSHGSFTDRKRVFKDNHLPATEAQSFFRLLWATYNDKVLILLTAAAIISLAIGLYQTFDTPRTGSNPPVEWVEGVAIIIAIVVIVLVGSVNDFQKERQFLRLNRKKQCREIIVIRSGKTQRISVFDVLVGDVVHLEPGDVVPTDGIFIQGYNVQCDESLITGETDHIGKHPADDVFQAMQARHLYDTLDPFIFSGSKVAEGIGTYVVTATGINSSYGKMLGSLNEDPEFTPLQLRLDRLAKQIANIGVVLALVMFSIMFIKFAVQLRHSSDTPTQKGQLFLNVLIIALTILVIVVPEGLPLAVTLALAFATAKMVRDHNLVRRLKSCETMGNVTSICSDKTGTLTQNEMKVVIGTIGRRLLFTDRAGDVPIATEHQDVEKDISFHDFLPIRPSNLSGRLSKSVQNLLAHLIAINSTAFEDGNDQKQLFVGSKTETALLTFARHQLAMGSVGVERSNTAVVYYLPFHAVHQCMAAVVKLKDGGYRMYVKGAPEVLLAKCTLIVANPNEQLSATPITAEDTEYLQSLITNYASRSLRMVGLMYRDFEAWPPIIDQTDINIDNLLGDLVFLGILGIQDPLRPEVKDGVRACQKAGVIVRMVTGDNIWTAKAIAQDSGILSTDGTVMEGVEFRSLSESQMDEVIPQLRVLARVSPEDKRILVTRLRNLGEIVAVTGDGSNDTLALVAADIGISMGISGTEVAKEAADIILMDDNFSSIVKAIMWGRAINDSVKKFLQVHPHPFASSPNPANVFQSSKSPSLLQVWDSALSRLCPALESNQYSPRFS